MSQTQLSNLSSLVGILVIVAQQFGVVLDPNKTVFVIASLWSLGWTAYSYWQRYQKGDVNLIGARK